MLQTPKMEYDNFTDITNEINLLKAEIVLLKEEINILKGEE
jgi:hypothetical protein